VAIPHDRCPRTVRPDRPEPRARRARTTRRARTAAALVCSAALALTAAGCGSGGTGGTGGTDAVGQPVTITFWHGWSEPSEIAAVNANIASFEKLYPNIRVDSVADVSEPTLLKGLHRTGAGAPDVISDFTSQDVGPLCSSGALLDLDPLLARSGVAADAIFPKAMLDYTRYQGKQCTLPLLGDAYGLYYNVSMFHAAGISGPPRTFSQLASDAVRLTLGDGSRQLGYMPLFENYENDVGTLAAQYDPRYFTRSGASNLAGDPAFADLLRWQQDLVGQLGGYDHLARLRTGFGDEFTPANAFDRGKVAMQLDGEWRVANLTAEKVPFQWATAPFPVPDDQAADYGRGYLSGTVIGINHNSRQQQAAWQFVKYLTTDTQAVVSFANAIDNVPSTFAALDSPELQLPPAFQTFVGVADSPYSDSEPPTADDDNYVGVLQQVGTDHEAGSDTDLTAALQAADQAVDKGLGVSGPSQPTG
jgi:multiple sugar transport system substrate-binding protein